jgi:chromosome partitioning protein
MGKIIAVANQKGGVGKTTTAVNLSAALGDRGKKVLLVDIDTQGNSTSGYGISKREAVFSSYDVFVGNAAAEEAIIKTKFKNVDVLPANKKLSGVVYEVMDQDEAQLCLKKALAPVRGKYDFILLDCPPALDMITVNALSAADTLLVPIQAEYFALEGLSQLMPLVRDVKRLHNPGLDIEGVLFTMFDNRLNLTRQVVAETKKYFPKKVFSTVIPRSVRLSEAPSYGEPILYYDKKSKGAAAYNDLAKEIIRNNRK